ncbi:MAG: hypothetical protein AB7F89_08815 [Pirellulaceae bacterium]
MSIDRIRRLVDVLPSLSRDGEWLADALRRYIDEAADGITLDEVLGVATPRGGRPWWKAEALRRRDESIARLRNLVPANGFRSEALAIRAAAIRYRRTRYRSAPADDTDPAHVELRALLDTTGGDPPSRKAIERALANRDTRSAISCRDSYASISTKEPPDERIRSADS